MHQSQPIDFTNHARHRQRQRAISDELVREAIWWGREFRQRDGCTVYRVGRREAQEAGRREIRGLVVVLSPNGAVITVYRSRDWPCWDGKRRRRFRSARPHRRQGCC